MESVIANYIEVDGEEVLFETLEGEQQNAIAKCLQEQVMLPLGYRNKECKGTVSVVQ